MEIVAGTILRSNVKDHEPETETRGQKPKTWT